MEMSYPLNLDEYIYAEVVQLWHYGRTTGVFSADEDLSVLASDGMNVTLSPGAAWIKYSRFGGIVYGNTEDMLLSIDLGDSTLNRIDRVCIRYSFSENVVRAIVKKGQLASQPIPPALQRDLEAYELAVADIRVNAGTSTITQAMIFDQRLNESVCGVVRDGVAGIPTQQFFDQWVEWMSAFTQDAKAHYANYQTMLTERFLQFLSIVGEHEQDAQGVYNAYETRITDYEATARTDFENWFDTVRGIINEEAVGSLYNIVEALSGRVGMIEQTIYHDITANQHTILFDTLDEITATGYWDAALRTIEC